MKYINLINETNPFKLVACCVYLDWMLNVIKFNQSLHLVS